MFEKGQIVRVIWSGEVGRIISDKKAPKEYGVELKEPTEYGGPMKTIVATYSEDQLERI